MMSHFHLVMPIKAAKPTTTANQSTTFADGKMTWSPNQTAKFRTTPTTAAVTADKSFVSAELFDMRPAQEDPQKTWHKPGAHTLGFDADRNKVYAFLPKTHRAAVYVDQGRDFLQSLADKAIVQPRSF
jgi:hypothetical protein